jgi:hypothetical protein
MTSSTKPNREILPLIKLLILKTKSHTAVTITPVVTFLKKKFLKSLATSDL